MKGEALNSFSSSLSIPSTLTGVFHELPELALLAHSIFLGCSFPSLIHEM